MKCIDIATFVGKQGHRFSQIYTMEEDKSSFIVDYYDDDKYIGSLFYRTQDRAEESAQSFAFKGLFDGNGDV